jgi:DNA-binding transcriptional LysR family regulator
MELRQLRVFVTVAEEGHFSRAAARLHIVQPAVSQQVQRLERELSAILFDRSARGAQLTAAGKALLAEARQMLAEEARMRRTVSRAARGETGQVRVGCVPSGLTGVLPKVLPAFRSAYPEVGVFVRELHTDDLFDALRNGRIDIAFVRATQPTAGVTIKPLLTEPLLVALPADHWLARRRHVSLAALASESFVMFTRALAPEYFDRVLQACHAAGFIPDVTHEVTSDHAQLGLIACSLGVALVPACTTSLQLTGVTYRELTEPDAQAPMAAAYAPDRPSLLRDEMLNTISEVFPADEAPGCPRT